MNPDWVAVGPTFWATATWPEVGWLITWGLIVLLCLRSFVRRVQRLVEVRRARERASVRIVAEDFVRRALFNGAMAGQFALAGVLAASSPPGRGVAGIILLLITAGLTFAVNVFVDEPRAVALRHAVERERKG